MNAISFVAGAGRVDEDFLKDASKRNFVTFPMTDGISLKFLRGGEPKLVCEWDVQEGLAPSMSFSRAKAEILVSAISGIRYEALAGSRTAVRFVLKSPPQLTIGMQSWDTRLSRRCRTRWLKTGAPVDCSALPHQLWGELSEASQCKITLKHTIEKVRSEFSQACGGKEIVDPEASPAPSPSRKHLLETPGQKSKELKRRLKETNSNLKKQKRLGSDGQRCDAGVRPVQVHVL